MLGFHVDFNKNIVRFYFISCFANTVSKFLDLVFRFGAKY